MKPTGHSSFFRTGASHGSIQRPIRRLLYARNAAGYEPLFFPFSAIDRHWQLLEFCDVGDEALGNVIEIFDGDVSEIDHEVRVLCAPQRFTPEEA